MLKASFVSESEFEFKPKKKKLFRNQLETKQRLKQHILLRDQQRKNSLESQYCHYNIHVSL